MKENLYRLEFWKELRKTTRVKNNGQGQCGMWCEDALKNEEVAGVFAQQTAELGELKVDLCSILLLVHHWLESEDFIADGTAGQFEPELKEGYYGLKKEAPKSLQNIYSRKVVKVK